MDKETSIALHTLVEANKEMALCIKKLQEELKIQLRALEYQNNRLDALQHAVNNINENTKPRRWVGGLR